MGWNISFTYRRRGLDGAGPTANTVDELVSLINGAVISYSDDSYTIERHLDDDNLDIHAVDRETRKYIANAGLPKWPTTRIDVVEDAELEEELATPNFPELLGLAEVAELLQVTRQRASELTRTDRFPQPVADLASGPVWTAPAVYKFSRDWERRPGRPPKNAA